MNQGSGWTSMASGKSMFKRHTLKEPVSFEGRGVHGDLPVSLTMKPAAVNTGIVFVRTDVTDPSKARIEADIRHVAGGVFCTELTNSAGVSVRTIEHALAALMAAGIDDVIIETDRQEIPILDGSALPFMTQILKAGRMAFDEPRRYLRLLEPVEISEGDSFVRLTPGDSFSVKAEIDFDHMMIGRQRFFFDSASMDFHRVIAPARTFGFLRDAEFLRQQGFALGATLDNTIVLTQSGMMNTSGLRFSDEFVRHKILDIYGDFALLGRPFLGAVNVRRGGHRLNHMAMQALLNKTCAWTITDADACSSAA
jgi:UDP-3-O-[3-hydroxymyristoyl] N-acetylglucosamine deacetylase